MNNCLSKMILMNTKQSKKEKNRAVIDICTHTRLPFWSVYNIISNLLQVKHGTLYLICYEELDIVISVSLYIIKLNFLSGLSKMRDLMSFNSLSPMLYLDCDVFFLCLANKTQSLSQSIGLYQWF